MSPRDHRAARGCFGREVQPAVDDGSYDGPETETEQCNLCFARGYRGGGRLPTCRRCGGTGEVPVGSKNPDPWGWDPVKRVVTYNGRPVR